MKPQVVYHGREIGSSLLWLALALFLGGSPLAVYFTTPQPVLSQLVLALVLGGPLFAWSLRDLGKSTGLILNPQTRQLKYVKGFFARRTTRVYSYDEVREVHLLSRRGYPNSKGAPEACWSLRIGVGRDESILLQEWSYEEAARRARYLGATFDIQPRVDGEPLYVEMKAVPRPSTDRRFLTYAVFYGLGALVLVMAIIIAALRFVLR